MSLLATERWRTPGGPWGGASHGRGPAVLFLHGWSVHSGVWRQQVKHFRRTRRVLTVDLPGHGATPWRALSLEELAAEVVRLLDLWGERHVDLVGSSLGGLIALKTASLVPERIRSVVFVGSQPRFSAAADYPCGLREEDYRRMERQLEADYPGIVLVFFRSLFTAWEREGRRFRWMMRFRREEPPPLRRALRHFLDILRTEDLRPILRTMACPWGCVIGTEDPICLRRTWERLRPQTRGGRFVWFDRCGHFPFLSRPYAFNAVLEEFWTGCR